MCELHALHVVDCSLIIAERAAVADDDDPVRSSEVAPPAVGVVADEAERPLVKLGGLVIRGTEPAGHVKLHSPLLKALLEAQALGPIGVVLLMFYVTSVAVRYVVAVRILLVICVWPCVFSLWLRSRGCLHAAHPGSCPSRPRLLTLVISRRRRSCSVLKHGSLRRKKMWPKPSASPRASATVWAMPSTERLRTWRRQHNV
jgi:hypothetical protein